MFFWILLLCASPGCGGGGGGQGTPATVLPNISGQTWTGFIVIPAIGGEFPSPEIDIAISAWLFQDGHTITGYLFDDNPYETYTCLPYPTVTTLSGTFDGVNLSLAMTMALDVVSPPAPSSQQMTETFEGGILSGGFGAVLSEGWGCSLGQTYTWTLSR